MRLSAKSRYALASMTYMAQQFDRNQQVTLIRISEHLGISKLYLEQVFNLLKKGNLVTSIKGAQGGYRLARNPHSISVYDILIEIEHPLFEQSEKTVRENCSEIDDALRYTIFNPLDYAVKKELSKTTLHDLVLAAQKYKVDDTDMYYI